jgi:hypothetical protein
VSAIRGGPTLSRVNPMPDPRRTATGSLIATLAACVINVDRIPSGTRAPVRRPTVLVPNGRSRLAQSGIEHAVG